jgi:ATP-dependent Clp protease adapter protein ClpS
LNDDFTPREFVVRILKAEFRMNQSQARQVMMTAHQRGACVVGVFVQDIAETKAEGPNDEVRRRVVDPLTLPLTGYAPNLSAFTSRVKADVGCRRLG